jgi:hypothetical protein
LYQAKYLRLRAYINKVWDVVDNFFLAFNISFVPREDKSMAYSLAVSTSNFRVPLPPKVEYEVEVKTNPLFPTM